MIGNNIVFSWNMLGDKHNVILEACDHQTAYHGHNNNLTGSLFVDHSHNSLVITIRYNPVISEGLAPNCTAKTIGNSSLIAMFVRSSGGTGEREHCR